MNAEYIKHVTISKKLLFNNRKLQHDLCLDGIINYDLDAWIEHVKIFYITILSNTDLFDKIQAAGIGLENIESAIEMMIQLEEHMVENKKETENEFWN